MMKQGLVFLKILGWAVLLHGILILLTILEVFLYSLLVNPGQGNSVYEAHAQSSGPVISIVFGFFIVWWIARFMIRRNSEMTKVIGYGLPLCYIVVDIVLLVISGTEIAGNYTVFGVSYATKLAAGYIAMNSKAE
jgi:hypothetical protein